MPIPGSAWWHTWWGTHRSWLPGDRRGFRSHGHRIHSSGNYKNPPPKGERQGLYEYHRQRGEGATKIPRELRLIVTKEIAESLQRAGFRVMVVAVGPTHAHGVPELPIELRAYNKALGKAKCDASRKIRKALPGRIWARRDKHRMLRNPRSREDAYLYVRDDQGASA